MNQLSGLDAAFLFAETPSQFLHIGGLGIYDPATRPGETIRFKTILRNIESRLNRSKVFRRKLSRVPLDLDFPYWVDDPDFDIEFHVRHVALTAPADWRQLMIDSCRLNARSIDLTRPPWEIWVIEGLDAVEGVPSGSFAVLFKLHHCAVDGISGWEMLDALHDLTPSAIVAAESFQPRPGSGTIHKLARAALRGVTEPARLTDTLYKTLPIVRETLYRGAREMPLFAGTVPRTPLNGAVGPHRVHDSITVPLDHLRSIKALVEGATVNDAVVAIVGGALRNYLSEHDDLPERSLVAGCPISIRSEAGRGQAGNQAVFAMIPVGSDTAAPIERLRQVHRTTAAKKEFTHAVPASVLCDYAEYLPSALAGLAVTTYSRVGLANRHRPLFNTIVTNVPGSQQPLYFTGAKMLHYDAWGPIWDGLGLIHPVTSYCGDVTISFDADRDQMPDPYLYRRCLENSYRDMYDAAIGPS
ncbi:WS/DGAT/MGAT family O-acyltransferase [Rhodococcus sp. C26F]